MVRTGAITAGEARAAPRAAHLLPASSFGTREAPHFTNYVLQRIEKRFGTEALFRDGLQITTSLNLDLQHAAEDAARKHIADIKARNATNAALSRSAQSGEIMAMLGSIDSTIRASTARSTSAWPSANRARRSSRSRM